MKKLIKYFLFVFLLFAFVNANGQLKQDEVGTLSGVTSISVSHPNYMVRGTFVSSQNYLVAGLDPVTDVLYIAFENTAVTPHITAVFKINSITVVAGQMIDIDATSVRGTNVVSFPTSGVLYKSQLVPHDLAFMDGTLPENLKAGIHNHNIALLDSLIQNVTAPTSGKNINSVGHTKQLGDIVSTDGLTLADTTSSGANLATFYVSKIIDANNYEVSDNGIIEALTRNGQTLVNSQDYCLGDQNQLILCSTVTAGYSQKILSTVGGSQIIDIAENAFAITAEATAGLTGTDDQTLRYNGTTLEATSNLLGFSDGSYTIGNLANEPSAILDLSSTSKGLLAPRMTTVQKDAIGAPATGLMVYDTDLTTYQFFDGTNWTPLGGSSDNIYNTDGTFTGARAIDAGENSWIADNISFFQFDAETAAGAGRGRLFLDDAKIGARISATNAASPLERSEIILDYSDGVLIELGNSATSALTLNNYTTATKEARDFGETEAFDLSVSTTGKVVQKIAMEKVYRNLVSATQPLSSPATTDELYTVPAYLNGYTLTGAYYSVATSSDATFNFQTNIAGSINVNTLTGAFGTGDTVANATGGTNIIATGDVLKVNIPTYTGTDPLGLEVTWIFEKL